MMLKVVVTKLGQCDVDRDNPKLKWSDDFESDNPKPGMV